MDEFKSNSYKSKDDEQTDRKKLEKVIKGKVITKKKSSSKKLAEDILSEDANAVGSYLLSDVLIPAFKDTLYDMVTSGLSMLLGGEGRISGRGYGRASTSSRTSYEKYSKPSRNSYDSGISRPRERYNYDDVILGTRGEAEEVLDTLVGLVEEYGMASIADLYDLIGMPSNYTDNKYGWYDLKSAGVVRTREGFLIKLPRTTLLN